MTVRVVALLTLAALLAACPEPEPAPTDAGPDEELPLAILSFTVTPTSVAAGEPVTLAWETSGASECTIDPAPGVVPRVGTAEVTPAQSTSYTLRCTRADEEVLEGLFVQVTGVTDAGVADGGAIDAGPAGDGGALDGGPVDAGPSVTGLVGARLEPMPTDLLALVSDDDVLVFPEQAGVVLQEDLECGVHVAASFDGPAYVLGGTIPAGTRVDSFFLRAHSTTKDVFDAELTFAREVLCIMPTDASLNASQPALAAPGTTYPSLQPDGGSNDGAGVSTTGGDRLSLSPDRRTVSVSYTTGTNGQDDTRVIVAALGQGPIEIRSAQAVRAEATSLVAEQLAALDTVFVVDELQGVTLSDALDVDLLAPGTVNGAGYDGGPPSLAPGTYDTVILHNDPTGTATDFAAATITFDRRIVAASVLQGTFETATTVLQSPITFDTLSTEWESDTDVLVIFLDERSLYVTVGTTGGRVDDARVFLEPAAGSAP